MRGTRTSIRKLVHQHSVRVVALNFRVARSIEAIEELTRKTLFCWLLPITSPMTMHNPSAVRRQLKPTAKKLGLLATVDFRSFRTMHSSLMSSTGVRPEVTRDNMGHANIDVTQNVYNKTWWEERVEAVSMAAASVWREFMPTPPVPAAM